MVLGFCRWASQLLTSPEGEEAVPTCHPAPSGHCREAGDKCAWGMGHTHVPCWAVSSSCSLSPVRCLRQPLLKDATHCRMNDRLATGWQVLPSVATKMSRAALRAPFATTLLFPQLTWGLATSHCSKEILHGLHGGRRLLTVPCKPLHFPRGQTSPTPAPQPGQTLHTWPRGAGHQC